MKKGCSGCCAKAFRPLEPGYHPWLYLQRHRLPITEAAVISVFYALFVSLFLYRTMTFRDIPPIFVEAIRTFTPILFILAASRHFPES